MSETSEVLELTTMPIKVNKLQIVPGWMGRKHLARHCKQNILIMKALRKKKYGIIWEFFPNGGPPQLPPPPPPFGNPLLKKNCIYFAF